MKIYKVTGTSNNPTIVTPDFIEVDDRGTVMAIYTDFMDDQYDSIAEFLSEHELDENQIEEI